MVSGESSVDAEACAATPDKRLGRTEEKVVEAPLWARGWSSCWSWTGVAKHIHHLT
jgi:hypothetical protein